MYRYVVKYCSSCNAKRKLDWLCHEYVADATYLKCIGCGNMVHVGTYCVSKHDSEVDNDAEPEPQSSWV